LGIVADALLELGSMQQQHVLVHKWVSETLNLFAKNKDGNSE
jgi:hypothetical protein